MQRRLIKIGAVAVVVAHFATVADAKTVVFDFEDQAFGAVTPVAINTGGVTATFTSPTDVSGFQIGGAFYKTLIGNYLMSPGPDYQTGNLLTIMFSQPVTAIQLNFATDTDPSLSLLTSARGTASATGIAPGGAYLYPEGILAFSGSRFIGVTLSSAALSFAVDNVTITTPEPSAAVLLGLGLVSAVVARRRSARTVA